MSAIKVKDGGRPRFRLSVDRQPRRALQYDDGGSGPRRKQARLGIIVSVGLAVFVFGVIVAS